jgi:opacity protein-like surface antigen
MRLKPYFGLTLAVLFVCAAYPAFAQTVPAAKKGSLPLAVGAGLSGYDPYLGQGRMYGGSLWIDYTPNRVPSFLHGLGLEVEARDISLGHSSSQPSNLREDTAQAGLIYSWRRFRNFRPYAKALGGFGSIDFNNRSPVYSHDTRSVFFAGAGVDYRVFRRVWVRADYEYQFWPDLLGRTTFDPQGFTVGASYHFSRPHFH